MQDIKIAIAKTSQFQALKMFYLAIFLGIPEAPRLILSLMKPHAFCSMYAGNVGFLLTSLHATLKRMVLIFPIPAPFIPWCSKDHSRERGAGSEAWEQFS